jgi:hypothetical protein
MAAGVDDGLYGGQEAQREEPLAKVQPDALDGIELGAVGGQEDQCDVGWDAELAADVPAGAVEHHDEVNVRRAGCRNVIEEHLHGAGIDGRQNERDVLARCRPDRGEDVGPLIADLLQARRPLAAPPPAVADPPLVADPRLILEPQLDPLAGMARSGLGYAGGEPPFLKASWASGSRWGWQGRAFWRDIARRLSTRVMLEG